MWWCCCAEPPEGKVAVIAQHHSLSAQFSFDDERSSPSVDGASSFAEEASLPRRRAGPPFVAVVTKSTKDLPLGVHVDLSDGKSLHICGVRTAGPTPVLAYNLIAPEGHRILAGDYIQAVNGFRGDAALMAEALSQSCRLELEIQRPQLLVRTIQRGPGEQMGLDLNYSEKGSSIVVKRLSPGAAERCAPDLLQGDRIVSVNGAGGNALQLLGMLCAGAGDEIELLISRRPHKGLPI